MKGTAKINIEEYDRLKELENGVKASISENNPIILHFFGPEYNKELFIYNLDAAKALIQENENLNKTIKTLQSTIWILQNPPIKKRKWFWQ